MNLSASYSPSVSLSLSPCSLSQFLPLSFSLLCPQSPPTSFTSHYVINVSPFILFCFPTLSTWVRKAKERTRPPSNLPQLRPARLEWKHGNGENPPLPSLPAKYISQTFDKPRIGPPIPQSCPLHHVVFPEMEGMLSSHVILFSPSYVYGQWVSGGGRGRVTARRLQRLKRSSVQHQWIDRAVLKHSAERQGELKCRPLLCTSSAKPRPPPSPPPPPPPPVFVKCCFNWHPEKKKL